MPFIFSALCTIYFKHYISCHFYFSHLSLFFSLLRHLIINMNHKKTPFKILGLFGYYPRHCGVLDFLDLGLETLAYVGVLVTLIDILSGVLEVYLKTLGCFFVFVQVIVITYFVCNP